MASLPCPITIPSTQAKLSDQGYTYNQAGQTYNQAGVMYGGVYNYNWDFVPMHISSCIVNVDSQTAHMKWGN